jgi:hypothetical protein
MELRRNRVGPEEISRFSDEAMARARDGDRLQELCLEWIGTVIAGPTAKSIPTRESIPMAVESGARGSPAP